MYLDMCSNGRSEVSKAQCTLGSIVEMRDVDEIRVGWGKPNAFWLKDVYDFFSYR